MGSFRGLGWGVEARKRKEALMKLTASSSLCEGYVVPLDKRTQVTKWTASPVHWTGSPTYLSPIRGQGDMAEGNQQGREGCHDSHRLSEGGR